MFEGSSTGVWTYIGVVFYYATSGTNQYYFGQSQESEEVIANLSNEGLM